MEMKKQKNRWIMLFCICCNTFCFGGVYAWSAFSGELANYMGWDYSKVTVAYSIMLMCVALMGLVGGMLLQRFGARKLMIAAGIMWGLGWFATGMAGSIIMLYASFGILAGCASGFGYNPGVVTAVSWFPDKKGFASGMAVGTCGMASLIVAPLANFLLTRFNVMTAFSPGRRNVLSCFTGNILVHRRSAGRLETGRIYTGSSPGCKGRKNMAGNVKGSKMLFFYGQHFYVLL